MHKATLKTKNSTYICCYVGQGRELPLDFCHTECHLYVQLVLRIKFTRTSVGSLNAKRAIQLLPWKKNYMNLMGHMGL